MITCIVEWFDAVGFLGEERAQALDLRCRLVGERVFAALELPHLDQELNLLVLRQQRYEFTRRRLVRTFGDSRHEAAFALQDIKSGKASLGCNLLRQHDMTIEY